VQETAAADADGQRSLQAKQSGRFLRRRQKLQRLYKLDIEVETAVENVLPRSPNSRACSMARVSRRTASGYSART